MPRSKLSVMIDRVDAMVAHVRAELDTDEYELFLDRVAPLPEHEQGGAKPKKGRKKRTASAPRQKRGLPDDGAAKPSDAACAECPHPLDANIHHKSTEPGYHEFKEAA